MSTGNHIAELPVVDTDPFSPNYYGNDPEPEAKCNYCDLEFPESELRRTYFKQTYCGKACPECFDIYEQHFKDNPWYIDHLKKTIL